jgi:hypothetical protein
MSNENKVQCPKCHTQIDVQDILAQQVEARYKNEYQARLAEEQKRFESEQLKLQEEKNLFEQKKKQENELFNERLKSKMAEERKILEEHLKKSIHQENEDQFNLLQKELNDKSEQIKELNRAKADIERLKREKDELKEVVELDLQRKMNEQLQTERERIRKMEEDRNELKLREMQKQLDDQKKLTEEMKRKQEQGSMQLQGEVQELAIEEWLTFQFPLDTIEEIKKGARGGDCIQVVNTHQRVGCGKIYYESKRTKEFQPSWIEKFKADMREKGADVGVLVTDARPIGYERMGIKDGVWICSYEEFKGLCTVLRETVIQLGLAISSQENKGDKMHLLYDFLTSNTFRMQVEAIVEGFSSMKNELEREKRSMQRIWKEREKQIEKVIANTIDMYGSIRGIAGSAIQPVQALELPGGSLSEEYLED